MAMGRWPPEGLSWGATEASGSPEWAPVGRVDFLALPLCAFGAQTS